MPASTMQVAVRGTVRHSGDRDVLVLSERLDGHDTFLTGTLEVANQRCSVRILTLDDVTVLRLSGVSKLPISNSWQGTLHLPHGLRPREVPADLADSVRRYRRDLTALDDAELRYALTFLGESTSKTIRRMRVDVIVNALPALDRPTLSRPLLISLDVGGTLGSNQGSGLTGALMAASPLQPDEARRLLRDRLHVARDITDALIVDICNLLVISPRRDFPRTIARSTFTPYSDAIDNVRQLSYYGDVVTLSNVSCIESDPESLLRLFSPWIKACFPSCQIGYSKPDARAFEAVAEFAGRPLGDLVHIGDNWECDIVGAVNAGVRAIWLSKGRVAPDDKTAAIGDVHIVRNLREVGPVVQEIARSAL